MKKEFSQRDNLMGLVHCFSVDVEGFYESMAESFSVDPKMIRNQREKDEISSNVDEILEFLDEFGVKGTFFVLGVIAEQQKDVVRRIIESGHEIGSHGFEHLRLFAMSDRAVRKALCRSIKCLEDVTGTRVFGFRAPDFSINRENRHILDFIFEAGYSYDSSIYPISGHDVYGIPESPRGIHRLENGLIEYPPSTFEMMGKRIPTLGGGYFRIFPRLISEYFLKTMEKSGHSAMTYIHPYELGSTVPVVKGLSMSRKFRHYFNIQATKERFAYFFRKYSFGRAHDILHSKGFLEAIS